MTLPIAHPQQTSPAPRDPDSRDRDAWESAASAADSAAKEEIWEEVLRPFCGRMRVVFYCITPRFKVGLVVIAI